MGLKQDIVIVNQFSQPLPGGGTSRGGTPGAYVSRYMAREQATEPVAPIRRHATDNFVMRYMARADAVESAPVGATPTGLKSTMYEAQGRGGVAFGYGQVSLSDDQLAAAAADLQRHADAGKTWLKTVLSFEEPYLRKHKLIPEDFQLTGRGGYRGQLDQMKLRMAIMQGLERMSAGSGGFDDLRYVGVIQVDTEHVHCHLAMLDAGVGQVRADGTQRGKLLEKHKSRLRRGVDSFLDEKSLVAHLSSAVGYERRNVTSYIKRWALDRVQHEALPQLLVAALPKDRRLWRASTHDRRMTQANRLITELVQEQLEAPGSPLPVAMDSVREYAHQRSEREGLSPMETAKLIKIGREQITERAVNGVYGVLQSLPDDQLRVRTPMLELMTADYEQLVFQAHSNRDADQQQEFDLEGFSFRLRSYASRRREHKESAAVYKNLRRQWETADQAGMASEASRPLHDFYSYEQSWHMALMAKYQSYLPVADDSWWWEQRHQEILDYSVRLQALQAMRADRSLLRMKDTVAAEQLGRSIYDQPGAGLLTAGASGRATVDRRIDAMKRTYREKVARLQEDLHENGEQLVVQVDQSLSSAATLTDSGLVIPTGEKSVADVLHDPLNAQALRVDHEPAEAFEDVKALDLHHLRCDYAQDTAVGDKAFARFVAAAVQRQRRLDAAVDYLRSTSQHEAVADLPISDVESMAKLSRQMTKAGRDPQTGHYMLPSQVAAVIRAQSQHPATARSATTSLDAGLSMQLQRGIQEAVASPSMIEQQRAAEIER